MRHILLFTVLICGIGPLVALAQPAPPPATFAQVRDDAKRRVEAILGPDGLASLAPLVAATQRRLRDAVSTVNATQRTPRQILTRGQLFSLVQAGRDHPAQLNLSEEQRAAFAAYGKAIVRATLPILGDAGRQENGNLTPAQSRDLYVVARETARGIHQIARTDPMTSILSLPEMLDEHLDSGTLAVLAEIDLRSIRR